MGSRSTRHGDSASLGDIPSFEGKQEYNAIDDRNNTNYKHLCSALLLKDGEIVDACALAGLDVSRSKVNGWRRGVGALKKPDVGSRNPANRERRMKLMSDDEFDAFCEGVALLLRNKQG